MQLEVWFKHTFHVLYTWLQDGKYYEALLHCISSSYFFIYSNVIKQVTVKYLKKYCKPINIGGYLIWQILPSGHIDCYLNWLSLGCSL